MKQFFLLAAIICFGMAAIKFCTARMKPNSAPAVPQPSNKDTGVLTAQEAKQRMEENSEAIVLDVRTQEEFDQGHIPGAVCLPNEFIAADMPFPFGKDTELLLYCRSGNRSAEAAKKLRDLGFSNVFDFGGMQDWPYDITTE
ncbi:rhodanese-like domain-containing protein [Oscillibacter valericigenes]|uniref:rhodanese-like domain-containing protein n=1 Tax=Oscillibacter valericigenes TaxID=351091 RepID=UPI001F24BF74|nr:rhodanese-like domain-containing protein [Oscillibacter valericigenes]MCF2664076.1 rhodanese-like domain-containing protein [Oscillibacter valericigenes]